MSKLNLGSNHRLNAIAYDPDSLFSASYTSIEGEIATILPRKWTFLKHRKSCVDLINLYYSRILRIGRSKPLTWRKSLFQEPAAGSQNFHLEETLIWEDAKDCLSQYLQCTICKKFAKYFWSYWL